MSRFEKVSSEMRSVIINVAIGAQQMIALSPGRLSDSPVQHI